jgi:para-aminobenzoate synthetase/4-amino-4-deoxychorismate lyase
MLSQIPIHSSNLFLYHKTTERTVYNRQREIALEHGCAEVIFRNEKGHITEGAITNLIVKFDEAWFTPPIADGLLAGIWRQHVIQERTIKQHSLSWEILQQADEIWIGNSVIGPIRVEEVVSQDSIEQAKKVHPC